ncbi:hypothetical protein ACK1DB_004778, partial [Salmonella enterica]
MQCHRSSCAWLALNPARACRASSASPASVSYRETMSGNASALSRSIWSSRAGAGSDWSVSPETTIACRSVSVRPEIP